jgi:hypothetical protein
MRADFHLATAFLLVLGLEMRQPADDWALLVRFHCSCSDRSEDMVCQRLSRLQQLELTTIFAAPKHAKGALDSR